MCPQAKEHQGMLGSHRKGFSRGPWWGAALLTPDFRLLAPERGEHTLLLSVTKFVAATGIQYGQFFKCCNLLVLLLSE